MLWKEGSTRGLGAPADAVAALPRECCRSQGLCRTLGCRGLGHLELLSGSSASATSSFLRSLLCLVQLWGERAFIYCALHFSLLAGWRSVFLLPEPRQAVFFCAQLQGVTPLFPTLTSKAAVWSFPCVTENNHWSRFLTNFDWLVSLVFITFVSILINTHVTIILLPAGDPELDLLLCYLYSVFVFGISWLIVCSVKFWLYF